MTGRLYENLSMDCGSMHKKKDNVNEFQKPKLLHALGDDQVAGYFTQYDMDLSVSEEQIGVGTLKIN